MLNFTEKFKIWERENLEGLKTHIDSTKPLNLRYVYFKNHFNLKWPGSGFDFDLCSTD